MEVCAGAKEMRRFLNGKRVGEQPVAVEQRYTATFAVLYAPGTLKAVGMKGDRGVAEGILTTAGAPDRT